MSKLIDYAGLTEFYNKFKDEINAPQLVYLKFTEPNDAGEDENNALNAAALSDFEARWEKLHGGASYFKGAYFCGVFRGPGQIASMIFTQYDDCYYALSKTWITTGNNNSSAGNVFYFYSIDNTGVITRTKFTDSSKQDKLTSGTNIKTINNQSLLGSGNINITAPSITVDTSMSNTSTNPVQNKVIKAYIDGLVGNVAARLAQI